MIEVRLRPSPDPQADLRRVERWVTTFGGAPVQGGVRKNGRHFGEYRLLGLRFIVSVQGFTAKPVMTLVETSPGGFRQDSWVTLVSADHQFVCRAQVPRLRRPPDVLLWGDRAFVRIGSVRYREARAYSVAHPVDFRPPPTVSEVPVP